MEGNSCVVFCNCGASVIPEEKARQLADGLKGLESDVVELNDLCAFSVHEKDFLSTLGGKYRRKIIIACYPRAVKNMLRQGSVEPGDYEVLNFRELSAGEILNALQNDFQITQGVAVYLAVKSSLEVPAWFPVIDQSRCTLCGKCARFCLFGVYRFDKKSLDVVNPLACKNNCPACGRTCPSSAIIFPRLTVNSVLAGAEPEEAGNTVPNEISFVMLHQRNRDRKNIFRSGLLRQAEEERTRALEEIKQIKTNRE